MDSRVERGELAEGRVELLTTPQEERISAIAPYDAERLLVVARGRLGFWSRAEPRALDLFESEPGARPRLGPLAVSPDRRWAAWAGEGELELWDLSQRVCLARVALPGERTLSLEVRDDRHVFVLISPRRLRVFALKPR